MRFFATTQSVRDRLGPETKRSVRRALRPVSRFRWLTKARLVRSSGQGLLDRGGRNLRYVLTDPEVESYSYDLANEAELAAMVATVFGVPAATVEGWIQETRDDPELTTRLSERTRWRLDAKTRMPLGNRMLWYLAARARRPVITVETGVYDGLGSLVLLRALQRNAEEGQPGRLLSIDDDPRSGWLVRDDLRGSWERQIGFTFDLLPHALAGRRVGLWLQDTPHTEENQTFEFGVALDHADDPLVIVEGSGGYCPTFERLCAARHVTRHHFIEQPVDHFYPPHGSGFAVFPQVNALRT